MTPDDDYAMEFAPGLPQKPPAGEEVIWQGRPNVWRLTVESMKLYWVLGYFALLGFYRVTSAIYDHGIAVAFASLVPIAVLAAIASAILFLIAFVQARVSIYTLTTERAIFRVGAATSVTLQVPFKQIQNAALDLRQGGTGTIVLEPKEDGGEMLSVWYLWPHIRPWHWKKPQPAFRCIPNAEKVAAILAEAAEDRMAQPEVARPAARVRRGTTDASPVDDAPSGAVPAE